MVESHFLELERLFLALCDKTRLRLLALMADGAVSVGFLADALNESQPKVSRHLAYLRNADVVYTERDGKWIYYGIRYPDNELLRGVLETVVSSLTSTSEEDEVETDDSTEIRAEIETTEYEPAYEDQPAEEDDEQVIDEWTDRPEEMEIFLL